MKDIKKLIKNQQVRTDLQKHFKGLKQGKIQTLGKTDLFNKLKE